MDNFKNYVHTLPFLFSHLFCRALQEQLPKTGNQAVGPIEIVSKTRMQACALEIVGIDNSIWDAYICLVVYNLCVKKKWETRKIFIIVNVIDSVPLL